MIIREIIFKLCLEKKELQKLFRICAWVYNAIDAKGTASRTP